MINFPEGEKYQYIILCEGFIVHVDARMSDSMHAQLFLFI